MADSSYGAMVVRDADYGDVNGNGESMALSLGANGDSASTTELLTGILSGVETIAEAVTAMWQGDEADRVSEEIDAADDQQPAEETDDDDEGGGFFAGAKAMAGKPSVKFALLLGGLALLMKFADKLIPILAPILKFIKEDVWPIAVKAVTAAFDALTLVFNKVKDAILFLTDPETSLAEKMEGVKTAFKDFGLWLFGIFDNMATKIATAFGMEFAEGETLGSWVGDRLKEGWANIKAWFEGVAPAWLIDDMKTIGSWLVNKVTTAFQGIVDFFTGAVEAWKVDGFTGVWDYIKGKVIEKFQPIIDFFGGAVEAWKVDGFSGVWDYVKGKVTAVFTGIANWFKTSTEDGGLLDFDGNPNILSWIVEKLKLPFEFLGDLFSWPESEEGIFSFDFLGKTITKFLDLVLLPWNLAINFLKSVFQWGDPEETWSLGTMVMEGFGKVWTWITNIFSWGDDDEKKGGDMSLADMALQGVKDAWEWVKDKFTFDIPKLKLPKLPSMEGMINSIIGAMLPEPGSWLYDWIPGGDALEQMAIKARMANDVTSMDVGETDMTGSVSTGTKETMNEYNQLKKQEGPPGTGMNINTIDSSSPTTVNNENVQVIPLETDHSDPIANAIYKHPNPKMRMSWAN